MWAVMPCCVWKMKMFWQIPTDSEPRPPPTPPAHYNCLEHSLERALVARRHSHTANLAPRYLRFNLNGRI